MIVQKLIKKIGLSNLSQRLRIITVVLFMAAGTYLLTQTQAAAGYIYISPVSASHYVGQTFSVQVRIRTTSPINAAFVDMNYNGRGLQVLSIQRGADFPNQNAPTQHTPSSTGTGTIKMQSTRNTSSAGDFHYATITFRATRTGTYGFTPLASSHLINYPANEVSYTFGRGDYSFSTAPAPPPAPAPSPAPSPAPAPSPSPSPKPSPSPLPRPSSAPTTVPTANIPKTESAPSSSNLKISNFNIVDLGYRSAVVTWDTNQPASSKVNFGYTSANMPYEVTDPAKTTSHRLVVEGNIIRAGNKYAARITSDDGKGPVTLDGEFSTKGIRILVMVADQQDNPVMQATVSTDTIEVITGEDGMASMTVPEGDVTFDAKKDNQEATTTANIAVPASADAPPQQVNIKLKPGSESTDGTPQAKKSSPWILILPIILLGGLGVAAVIVIRRRRAAQVPYEYELPTPNLTVVNELPTTPLPTHTPTLPELVQQDLAAKHPKPAQPNEEVQDMFSILDNPNATIIQPQAHPQPEPPKPTPHIIKHPTPADVKPVEHPKPPEPKPPEPEPPEPPEEPEPPKPKEEPKAEHPKKHHKDAEVDPKDQSLHIFHDDD